MSKLQYPVPLGYPEAARNAHSIAGPLFAAAALSLAGVVAGADDKIFLIPGPTLLFLIVTSLLLVASIQLSYYSRQFLYSGADILGWFTIDPLKQRELYEVLCRMQIRDYKKWDRFNRWAVRTFNAGTVLLGVGIALALLPPGNADGKWWRVAAASLVGLAALGDIWWVVSMRGENGRLRERLGRELNAVADKLEEYS